MAHDTPATHFADFLSDLSIAIAAALQSRDEATIEELSGHLTELAEAAETSDEPQLAAYFDVLRGILHGDDVSAAAADLVEPYRAGYERILQELEEEPEENLTDMTLSEWLANLTTIAVTTVKRGSDEDRVELEQALTEMAGRVQPEEVEFHDFLAALRGVLQGEDTRTLALRLRPPYREAYQSMLQLLAVDDIADFVLQAMLDRIQHNTMVALTHGDAEVRAAVAEALTDIESRVPDDDPTAAHFGPLIAGARALLRGEEPPARVTTLPEPFAETWRNILTVFQQN